MIALFFLFIRTYLRKKLVFVLFGWLIYLLFSSLYIFYIFILIFFFSFWYFSCIFIYIVLFLLFLSSIWMSCECLRIIYRETWLFAGHIMFKGTVGFVSPCLYVDCVYFLYWYECVYLSSILLCLCFALFMNYACMYFFI